MKPAIAQELKQLTLDEIEYRKKFKKALKELNDLVSPITKHNRKCCEFFAKHLPDAQEIVVIMDNNITYKIVAPKLEECSVETYLPYGIDYKECQLIDVK